MLASVRAQNFLAQNKLSSRPAAPAVSLRVVTSRGRGAATSARDYRKTSARAMDSLGSGDGGAVVTTQIEPDEDEDVEASDRAGLKSPSYAMHNAVHTAHHPRALPCPTLCIHGARTMVHTHTHPHQPCFLLTRPHVPTWSHSLRSCSAAQCPKRRLGRCTSLRCVC